MGGEGSFRSVRKGLFEEVPREQEHKLWARRMDGGRPTTGGKAVGGGSTAKRPAGGKGIAWRELHKWMRWRWERGSGEDLSSCRAFRVLLKPRTSSYMSFPNYNTHT